MIDAGPLTQEDADEYRIELVDDSTWAGAIRCEGRDEKYAAQVTLTMSNADALELAAQLLIGAVYEASDADFRHVAWQGILVQRRREARKRRST